MTAEFQYRAFISYSHSDEEWARWLHKSLETYRVPKHLVGRETEFGPVPERLAPVFRDREELASATNLGDTLMRALQQSATQIVICSPMAAKSRWVNEEIKTFKRLGRSNRIFALIVDGEPGSSSNPATAGDECFPPALILRIGDDGQLTVEPTEPIAADVRLGKDSRLDGKLKLIAGILGVGLDELKQREAHRRHRRMMWLVSASVTGMGITSALAGAAWLARNEAERQRVRAEAEAETARQTTRFMVDLFKVSDPSEALGNTITAREILDKGAERIDRELSDQPAIQATLMDTMGTVYTSLGLYDPAARLMRRAVQQRRELFGPGHPEVASSLGHLGEVQMLKGEYAEAERNLRDSLETLQRVHGPRSAEAAQAHMLLADVLTREGRYQDAEPLIQQALGIRRALYGEKHPDVAASIEALGLNYYDRGDYERAIPSLRLALRMRRELHPQGHPLLAQSVGNPAWALMQRGDLAEAEQLQREALAMKRRLFGASHPEIASTLINLGYTLELRGNYPTAAQLLHGGARHAAPTARQGPPGGRDHSREPRVRARPAGQARGRHRPAARGARHAPPHARAPHTRTSRRPARVSPTGSPTPAGTTRRKASSRRVSPSAARRSGPSTRRSRARSPCRRTCCSPKVATKRRGRSRSKPSEYSSSACPTTAGRPPRPATPRAPRSRSSATTPAPSRCSSRACPASSTRPFLGCPRSAASGCASSTSPGADRRRRTSTSGSP